MTSYYKYCSLEVFTLFSFKLWVFNSGSFSLASKECRMQYGMEIEANLPDAERQMDEVSANLPPEQLCVARL